MFKNDLLNLLLDKYEKSKLSTNENKVNIRISVNVDNAAIFKTYRGNDAYKYRENMQSDVCILEDQGLVYCNRNCDELKSVYLNIEKIDDAFKFLKREKKTVLCKEYMLFINSIDYAKSEIASKYLLYILEELKQYKITAFPGEKELQCRINAIDEICHNKNEILLRNFSKKIFNDSKYFENKSSSYLSIFNKVGNIIFENFHELCSYYSIVKTPTFINVKGDIELYFSNGNIVNVNNFKQGIGVCITDINNIAKVSIQEKKIITIENYTTYLSFNEPGFVAIFLAGFHNKDKNDFLMRINQNNLDVDYYHFGDIDAGGIRIYNNLKSKTTLKFIMYKMDIATLEENKDNWQPLTLNDITNLNSSRGVDVNIDDIIEYMLNNNCKLEQEAIELYQTYIKS